MDRIVVPGLRVQARVGAGEAERARPQGIEVDVELHLDLGPAGVADSLSSTVDYERVCELVHEVVGSRAFHLIESVAEECAAAALGRFPVDAVVVRVRKPGALAAWGVPHALVEVHRTRHG